MSRVVAAAFLVGSLACCAEATVSSPAVGPAAAPVPSVAAASASPPQLDAAAFASALDAMAAVDAPAGVDAFDGSPGFDDPMALHYENPDSLRALMGEAATVGLPVGGGPWRLSQGNRAISRHAIGQRACLEGLRNVVLQTPDQRARCGADDMVPVWERGGSIESARYCIDIFEFPNKACELPFVFITPSQALRVCHAQGKRLCTQDEWNLACRADPAGGADRVYAYGDEMDLTVCNTDKSRAAGPFCDVSTNERLWTTCGTNTEPSGAFPRCRSRFGVFDQHGNVAEIMTRFEPADGKMYSQLKGSAFFYVDVAKKPTDPGGYWTKYPDQCNFDPRWHVEKIEEASHMNYHLGFRCCKTLASSDASAE
ncbi:MAG: SUMF1/EgtB/PvdO family nonheme iron enzyme [Polyangiaceae bacterium]